MNIQIEQLTKKFGDKTAVDIPEFFIEQGEIIGLVGNNGAGKTTLFRLLLDLLNADTGRILLSDDAFGGEIDPAQSEAWKQLTGAY
ncbi:MAG TPA: ATP-binding cassette domain-containing protein, partial [Prevotella sp.]